jgi:hypothetical protein
MKKENQSKKSLLDLIPSQKPKSLLDIIVNPKTGKLYSKESLLDLIK